MQVPPAFLLAHGDTRSARRPPCALLELIFWRTGDDAFRAPVAVRGLFEFHRHAVVGGLDAGRQLAKQCVVV